MSLTKIEYADFLQKAVFKTQEIGQFSILFELFDYIDLHEESLSILERSYIYGGVSIFAGLAPSTNPQVINYLPNLSSSRNGFQKSWLTNCGFPFHPPLVKSQKMRWILPSQKIGNELRR